MKKILYCILTIALSLSFSPPLFSQSNRRNPEITSGELQEHIKYLASDQLEGRKSGAEGNVLAAKYLAKEFELDGLKPMGTKGYFQEFDFVSTVKIGKNNSLSMTDGTKKIDFLIDEHFRPLGFSDDTKLEASVVFVGYGIADDSLHYNDYTGIDVKGKIVVMLRYSPHGKDDTVFTRDTPLRMKALTARNQGAVGMILISGPSDDPEGSLIKFDFDRGFGTSGIAAISMKWTAFDSLLQLTGKNIASLQKEIIDTKQPHSFELTGVTTFLRVQIEKVNAKSANVIGYLEGSDPVLKNEVIVIGAHFDHLGMGGEGSLKPDTVAIHHGADDNASGTAGMLELAEHMCSKKGSYKRSILFMGFSGEELGLLGSDYFVKEPTVPLDRIVAMVNMDMIGRMKENQLVVEGMGTSPLWDSLARLENIDSVFKLTLKPDGYGPSDHASFYGKNIPVMFFFTNLHDDYHRPSDTWDKINYDGEEKVVQYVSRLANDIANLNEKPKFTKVQVTSPAGGDRQGVSVSLGIVPDYASDVEGLKITGTRAGSAAEQAGLKDGDVITKFGGKDVKNIYDFMYMLGDYKPGDEVKIVVKRGTEDVTLTAKLQARK